MAGGTLAALDAIELFSSGAGSLCFATVGVVADRSIRLARIQKRDGISREYATLREKRDEIRAESQKLGEQITELSEKRKQLYREDEEIITRMNEIQAELQNIA